MEVPKRSIKVEEGKLYVKREGGRWELFYPRSEAEKEAGRRLPGDDLTPYFSYPSPRTGPT